MRHLLQHSLLKLKLNHGSPQEAAHKRPCGLFRGAAAPPLLTTVAGMRCSAHVLSALPSFAAALSWLQCTVHLCRTAAVAAHAVRSTAGTASDVGASSSEAGKASASAPPLPLASAPLPSGPAPPWWRQSSHSRCSTPRRRSSWGRVGSRWDAVMSRRDARHGSGRSGWRCQARSPGACWRKRRACGALPQPGALLDPAPWARRPPPAPTWKPCRRSVNSRSVWRPRSSRHAQYSARAPASGASRPSAAARPQRCARRAAWKRTSSISSGPRATGISPWGAAPWRGGGTRGQVKGRPAAAGGRAMAGERGLARQRWGPSGLRSRPADGRRRRKPPARAPPAGAALPRA
jgi:hypothetical protein